MANLQTHFFWCLGEFFHHRLKLKDQQGGEKKHYFACLNLFYWLFYGRCDKLKQMNSCNPHVPLAWNLHAASRTYSGSRNGRQTFLSIFERFRSQSSTLLLSHPPWLVLSSDFGSAQVEERRFGTLASASVPVYQPTNQSTNVLLV